MCELLYIFETNLTNYYTKEEEEKEEREKNSICVRT